MVIRSLIDLAIWFSVSTLALLGVFFFLIVLITPVGWLIIFVYLKEG